MTKKFFNLLLILFIICTLTISSLAVESLTQSDSFYVADYSNIISDSVEQEIINYNGILENQCNGAQVVVVSVDYAQGMSSDQYAMKIFNDWGIGSKTYNNGILILLITQENKYYIQCGLGIDADELQTSISNDLDEFETNFDEKNYSEAVDILFKGILNYFNVSATNSGNSISNYNYEYGYTSNGSYDNFSNGFSSFYLVSFIIKFLLIILFIRAIIGSFRRSHYVRTGRWLPLFLLFGPRRPSRMYSNLYHNNDPFVNGFNNHNFHNSYYGGFSGTFHNGNFGTGAGHGSNGFGGGMGHGGGGFGGGGFGRK